MPIRVATHACQRRATKGGTGQSCWHRSQRMCDIYATGISPHDLTTTGKHTRGVALPTDLPEACVGVAANRQAWQVGARGAAGGGYGDYTVYI